MERRALLDTRPDAPQGLRVCNMMEGALTPLCTPEELKEMGFNIIIHPLSALFAATRALTNVYELLARKGTTRDDLQSLVGFRSVASPGVCLPVASAGAAACMRSVASPAAALCMPCLAFCCVCRWGTGPGCAYPV